MVNNVKIMAHADNIKKNLKFHMLCGIPGSGKSTFAKEKLTGEIISLDDIRKKKYGDASIQGNPKEVIEEAFRIIHDNLSNGKHVIYDATNIKVAFRKSFLDIARSHNAKVILHWIDIPLEEAKRRNQQRERNVDERIIDGFLKGFQKPTIQEGIDVIIRYDKDFNLVEQILPIQVSNELCR